MLEYVKLKGFQRHEDITADLNYPLVVICGATDSGKSSILRGINWLATNKPSGDGVINIHSSAARAELGVDGHKIVRKKGNGHNSYYLDGKKYVSFGSQPPEDITNLLNLSEDYYQSQHQNSFWVGLSAGQVSKELNKIVDLVLIDQTLFNLGSELRKSKTVAEITEKRLITARERRQELSWTVEADDELSLLEAHQQALMDEEEQVKILEQIMDRLEELSPQMSYPAPTQDMERLDSLKETAEQLTQDHNDLEKLIQKMAKLEDEKCQLQRKLQESEARLRKLSQGTCPLCGNPM